MALSIPFWDLVRSRGVTVLDRRRLHHLTRSVYEAAELIPAPLDRIVATIICWCGNRPALFLTTPAVRIDLDRIGTWFGAPVRPATPTEVSALAATHLQGVPPSGLAFLMPAFLDEELLTAETLWVPAGEPSLWLELTPADLLKVTGAYPVALRYREADRLRRVPGL
ncbi:MAG: prolyl-tRNA synthetase [Actinomycetia bacterium]|nr:prolyl-tRNA synthetase [Actinomycetes bacterium]